MSGKTAASIAAGAQISVYDTANRLILYSGLSDAKKAFNIKLLGADSINSPGKHNPNQNGG
ncbi:MAG: hypothetical protein ABL925_11025 [Methylococcales bacterium]